MKDLIEALTIFAKYTDSRFPINTYQGRMYVNTVDRSDVSDDDHKKLELLDFDWDEDTGYHSYRFGSN